MRLTLDDETSNYRFETRCAVCHMYVSVHNSKRHGRTSAVLELVSLAHQPKYAAPRFAVSLSESHIENYIASDVQYVQSRIAVSPPFLRRRHVDYRDQEPPPVMPPGARGKYAAEIMKRGVQTEVNAHPSRERLRGVLLE